LPTSPENYHCTTLWNSGLLLFSACYRNMISKCFNEEVKALKTAKLTDLLPVFITTFCFRVTVGTYSHRRNHGRVTASRQTEKTVDTRHWRVDWMRIHSAKGDVTRSSTMEKKDIGVVVCCRQASSRKVDYSEWVSYFYSRSLYCFNQLFSSGKTYLSCWVDLKRTGCWVVWKMVLQTSQALFEMITVCLNTSIVHNTLRYSANNFVHAIYATSYYLVATETGVPRVPKI